MSSNQPNPFFGPPPGLLRLSYTPDGGHVLKTTRRIKPGEIVMVDTPVAVYPSSLNCLSIFCSQCFCVLPSEPFHCPVCHEAHFCSDQCLKRSHPRLLCHALPALVSSKHTWPDDILFLLSVYSLPSKELSSLIPLHSNSSIADESIKELQAELAVLVPANDIPYYFTLDNTSALISKKKKCSFALKNPKDSKYESFGVAGARAYGLYLWASMLNHICIPNVCRFDYVDLPREKNTDIEFRALYEIQEEAEIVTSYVGVALEYRGRQNRLLEDYGLKCDCGRCRFESQWKENKGEEEESGEKNAEETTEGIEEMNKEEDTESNSEEGTDEDMEEETEENNGEETEEETKTQTEKTNEEESEGKTEEETEEQTEKTNEEESEGQTEEETEEQTEKTNEEETEEEVEVKGEEQEQEILEGGDDNFQFLLNNYIKRYICNCGGLRAPTPPSQDETVPYFMECNVCGAYKEDYEPGDPFSTAL